MREGPTGRAPGGAPLRSRRRSRARRAAGDTPDRSVVTRGRDMSDSPAIPRTWITERSGSPARTQVAGGRTASAASLTTTYPFGYIIHARGEVLRDRRWPERARGVHLSIAGTHARTPAGRHRGLPAVWREGADLLETDLGFQADDGDSRRVATHLLRRSGECLVGASSRTKSASIPRHRESDSANEARSRTANPMSTKKKARGIDGDAFPGLTQAQLATRIGTSQPTIARLEKGLDVRTPRWDTLQRIARALGRQLKLKFAAPSDDDELVEVEQPFRLHRKKGEAATAAAASRTHRSGGSPRRA
ncbi:MAG: helix-turn-helix transcriptional regulator [Deltaproteobacteria bacterium]|nr:MAG: helix-turn-helix transcriptional regulator [Deltaproteobacteria bacterium]